MLHADAFPCLTLKAYNGRVMAVFLETCLESHICTLQRNNLPVDVEVLNASVAIKALCAWFDILERSPRFLSQNDADATFNFGNKFLRTYERLGIIAVIRGSKRWKFIPKLHVFMHLIEDVKSTTENSRFFFIAFAMKISWVYARNWPFELRRGRCLNTVSLHGTSYAWTVGSQGRDKI